MEVHPALHTEAVLLHLVAAGNDRPFLAFRTPQRTLLLVGTPGAAGALWHRQDADAFGARADRAIAAGKILFGYTSYECFSDIGRQNEAWPLAVLCEASMAFVIDGDLCRAESGHDPQLLAALQQAAVVAPADTVPSSVRDSDTYWPAFLGKLRRIRDWAQKDLGKHRRLTISRTIGIDDAVDPVATFLASSPVDLSRSFLFRYDAGCIVGQSPELLIDGDTRAFSTFKLSGTAPRDEDMLTDDALLQEMIDSRKLRDEHEGSILATEGRLRTAGRVVRNAKFIQTLPELRHFVTRLDVENSNGLGLWGLLAAASPSGAHPPQEALALLKELETRPRGPYYGLIGYADGNRRLEFSQTIRSLFNSGRDGWFTRVGAAVTEDSLPSHELEETRTKLRNISFRKPA